AAAMAASNALPPSSRMRWAAAVAAGSAVATACWPGREAACIVNASSSAGSRNRRRTGLGCADEDLILLHQFLTAFDVVGVQRNTIDGADLLTLRLVKVSDAFSA